ncbi:MAG: SUMF1/EgtB/PvdO family nonheme iron enzyme [Acidobacteriota bacterium]|nr:SUMF1/EgtB/PvdO family nonheme iron enzyme [Acidobacteriota bacterium]
MSQAGRRSAILIGSSQFDREPLKAKPLQCPERDVDGMHTLLSAEEFGAFGEVFVFKNVHHQAALDQIDEVLSTAARDDQVLIYFSGHGETDLPGRLYLTTANTDTRRLVTTSIPIETLRTMIELSACKRIILILDCCFGGAAGKSFVKGSVDEKLKELARGYGVYILTASTAAQTAQDGEGDGYSLLTKHIITGIKEGAAANDDGLISMDGLYRYVYAQVTGEGYQEPMRWALNVKGEDLIIARAAALYSAERLQAFKKLINRLEEEQELEDEICDQVRLAIRQNQPKRDKRLFELLNRLHSGLKPGVFATLWSKETRIAGQSTPATFVVPPSGGRPAEAKPATHQAQPPEGGTTNKPSKSETTKVAANGFTDDLNGVPLEMLYVPGGKFKMGTPKGSGHDDERPQHDVTVPAFYMGKFQITQAQWKAVMEDNPSHFKGDDLPVETVSWEEAEEFCQKLQQMSQKHYSYRLPSEAEWEYACRAGTTGDYAGKLDEMAWYDKNSGSKTHPVGQKKPNAYGLYDMHGNVWEWCEDVWHDDYKGSPTDGSAWTEGGNQDRRVVRGGSWDSNDNYCRSAVRFNYAPANLNYNIGFRVVVSARTS